MALANKKLILRAVEPEDLELLYLWENMPEYWNTGNTRQPYSKFALKNYISQLHANIYDAGQLRMMMVSQADKETVGTVDLFDFDIHHSRVALGLFVAPDQHRKGYAKAALQLIENYVFDFLKINQLYCFIAVENKASVKLFSNENFSKVRLEKWIKSSADYDDVYIFQQFREDYLAKKQA